MATHGFLDLTIELNCRRRVKWCHFFVREEYKRGWRCGYDPPALPGADHGIG